MAEMICMFDARMNLVKQAMRIIPFGNKCHSKLVCSYFGWLQCKILLSLEILRFEYKTSQIKSLSVVWALSTLILKLSGQIRMGHKHNTIENDTNTENS